MLEYLTQYAWTEIAWIATSVFLMGVSKGGFPLGGLAMPILILIWPEQATAARSVVAFMLPLLCGMDVVSLIFYRKEVSWKAIAPLRGEEEGVPPQGAAAEAPEAVPVAEVHHARRTVCKRRHCLPA